MILSKASSLFLLVIYSGAVAIRAVHLQNEPIPNPSLRPLQPEDQQKLEAVEEPVFSPDGQLLAYTIVRSFASGVSPSRNALARHQRSEVWVVATSGGPAQKITSGESTGTGYWRPVWSPDSRRLVGFS